MLHQVRIGLISDTHIPTAGKELPRQVAVLFTGVDLILHAGDITVLSVLDWLEHLAPVVAALGNEDVGLSPHHRLGYAPVIRIAGVRIGLIHDPVYPELPLERAFGGRVDIVVHGHTHEPMIQRQDGVLFINPGSASFPYNRRDLPGTIGILEIGRQVKARILDLGPD